MAPKFYLSAILFALVPLSTLAFGGVGGDCDPKHWPDLDKENHPGFNGVCGPCLALINLDHYGTCGSYCAQLGMGCVGAWEEKHDDCAVQGEYDCNFHFGFDLETSDALCECGDDTQGFFDDAFVSDGGCYSDCAGEPDSCDTLKDMLIFDGCLTDCSAEELVMLMEGISEEPFYPCDWMDDSYPDYGASEGAW